jgi:uncharacterized membrane protein YtjA (UPF0391 family)
MAIPLVRHALGAAPDAAHARRRPHSMHRSESAVSHANQERPMLHYAVVFFVIALIAALFGFTGIAAGAASIAQVLFVVFIVLAIASFVMSMFRKR